MPKRKSKRQLTKEDADEDDDGAMRDDPVMDQGFQASEGVSPTRRVLRARPVRGAAAGRDPIARSPSANPFVGANPLQPSAGTNPRLLPVPRCQFRHT